MDQGKILTEEHQNTLLCLVTDEEIRRALFSIPGEKSPGPDGFGTHFFKDAWHIVGNDVIQAIQEFFHTGTLLKEVNNTLITLIPKSEMS